MSGMSSGMSSSVSGTQSVTSELSCEKCKMEFEKKINLHLHSLKCTGIHPLECPTCHFRFGTRQSKHTHIKKNTCKKLIESSSITQPVQALTTIQGDQNNITNQTNNTQINNITNQTNNTQINNITNQTNNTQHNTINIYGLGKEEVDYFTAESPQMFKLINRVIDRQKDGVCDLIYMKHFHPDHPENHNVKKMLKHDEVMHYFDGAKWQRREARIVAQNVLKGVVRNLIEMIDLFHITNHKMPKRTIDEFMENVGEGIDLDFTGDFYDYEFKKSEEEKERMLEQMVRYINNFIYEKTKEMCGVPGVEHKDGDKSGQVVQ